ncbi:MAG: HtaA domain-containing protein [Actinobacteria bacterium]|nr:HtaA domain-containing protein [Actinomycetota bacterium]
MTARPHPVRRRRRSVVAALVALAVAAAVAAAPGSAAAAPLTVTDASLRWRFNPEVQGTSPFGECNYLSAGRSDGSEASYRASEGDVTIEKAGGAPTWATKCELDDQRRTDQELIWTGGTGTVDPDTGEVTLAFEGAASVVFYGGLLPFTIVDPVITVDAEGNGSMVATMEGFASSLDDPHTKTPIDPVPGVVVADVRDVDSANDTGFVARPEFGGVRYDADTSIAAPQVRTTTGWGSWPVSFVDFHMVTGLSSYWYTSGGAFDAKKPPLPFQITYEGIGEPLPQETTTTTATTSSTTTTAAPAVTTSTSTPSTSGSGSGPSTTVAPGSSSIVYRTVGGSTADGGTTPTTGAPTRSAVATTSRTGALAWSVPADGVLAPSGDELGPIAVADTRDGRGWTMVGRVWGATAGWTPKLLREGAGTELGHLVVGDLSRPSVLALAPDGHPSGWSTVAADLEVADGEGPITVTVTAIS